MAKGTLRCCGSSLFLKNHFGVGYNMTIEKSGECDSAKLKEFIKARIPEAHLLSDVGSEVVFQLPMSASSKFQSLFENLDDNLQTLGVDTYGMSVTTLEEVFIRVAKGEELDQNQKALIRRNSKIRSQESLTTRESKDLDANASPKELEVDYHDHWNFFKRHMFALLMKRLLYFKRDKKAWFYQVKDIETLSYSLPPPPSFSLSSY